MTTIWQPSGEWAGETVAVLASGPSLTPEVAHALREHRRIVVNQACRLAPDADMLVANDANWPQNQRDFAGIKVTAVEDETLDGFYIGPQWVTVELAPGHLVHVNNSGATAVQIARRLGAARIILAGFDYPETARHFYDDEVDDGQYAGLQQAMAAVIAEAEAAGVKVERYMAPAKPKAKKDA